MIDRLLDRFLPTRQRPQADLGTVASRSVIIDRALAGAIDLLVCYVLIEAPVLYVFDELRPTTFEALGAAAVVLSLLLLLPIYLTYSFAFEWRYGRTPGKVNRALIVVMADGRNCSLRAAALRNLLRYVDLLGVPPIVVGLFCALVADGRRVGDLAAGTVVVRTRLSEDDRPGPPSATSSETGA